jgi:hypothetical protein
MERERKREREVWFKVDHIYDLSKQEFALMLEQMTEDHSFAT